MKKSFRLIAAICFSFFLASCSTATSSGPSSVNTSIEIPVLSGSDALSLANSISTEFGIDYIQYTDEKRIQYAFEDYEVSGIAGDVWCDLDNNIMSIDFLNINGDPSILEFVANVHYSSASPEEAKAWVSENIGTKAQIQFGEANFSVHINDSNETISILIEVEGLEEYYFGQS